MAKGKGRQGVDDQALIHRYIDPNWAGYPGGRRTPAGKITEFQFGHWLDSFAQVGMISINSPPSISCRAKQSTRRWPIFGGTRSTSKRDSCLIAAELVD